MDAGANQGLTEYRWRAFRAAGLGCVGLAVGSVVASASEDVGMAIVFSGVMAMGVGAVGVIRTIRIRRLAERQGWRRREARFRVVGGGNGQPALVLLPSSAEGEAVLSVSTTVFRWGALDKSDTVWLTGDPQTRFAAVGTADFGAIIVVKRPIMKWWRSRLRRIAMGT